MLLLYVVVVVVAQTISLPAFESGFVYVCVPWNIMSMSGCCWWWRFSFVYSPGRCGGLIVCISSSCHRLPNLDQANQRILVPPGRESFQKYWMLVVLFHFWDFLKGNLRRQRKENMYDDILRL